MEWDYGFAFATLTILAVLQVFYLPRMRLLPTRQNQCFCALLYTESLTMILSLASVFVNSRHDLVPTIVLFFINISFGVSFLVCIYLGYEYVAAILHVDEHRRVHKIFSTVPLIGAVAICIFAPFAGYVVYISPSEGYIEGAGYSLLYVVALYYFCLTAYVLVTRWRQLSRRIRYTILIYSLIISAGLALRYVLNEASIIYFSALVATLIAYLCLQGPSFYINSRTRCFNHQSLAELMDDCQLERQDYVVLAISLNNYEGLRVIYGDSEISRVLADISIFLQKDTCPHITCCYMGNGRFVLFSKKCIEAQSKIVELEERFKQPWTAIHFDIYFSFTAALVPSTVISDTSYYMDKSLFRDPTSPLTAILHCLPASHNELKVVTKDDVKDIEHELNNEKILTESLDAKKLELFLQPLFAPSTHKLVAAEALTRLPDGCGGYIGPEDFIPIAENNGSIDQLDEQILEKTCEFIASHDLKAIGINFISVNISPLQCLDHRLPQRITSLVDSYGIPHEFIRFEITETTTIDPSLLQDEMRRMHADGFSFALDDFGSGYSNFKEIIQLPFDVIKIDKSIVDAYSDKINDLLPAVIKMIRNLGYRIVVEGVETQEMANEVIKMGCDYIQGYYYARPSSIPEFVDLVKHFNNTGK